MRTPDQKLRDIIQKGFPLEIAVLSYPAKGNMTSRDWAKKAQKVYKEAKDHNREKREKNARRLHPTT